MVASGPGAQRNPKQTQKKRSGPRPNRYAAAPNRAISTRLPGAQSEQSEAKRAEPNSDDEEERGSDASGDRGGGGDGGGGGGGGGGGIGDRQDDAGAEDSSSDDDDGDACTDDNDDDSTHRPLIANHAVVRQLIRAAIPHELADVVGIIGSCLFGTSGHDARLYVALVIHCEGRYEFDTDNIGAFATERAAVRALVRRLWKEERIQHREYGTDDRDDERKSQARTLAQYHSVATDRKSLGKLCDAKGDSWYNQGWNWRIDDMRMPVTDRL